jgi:hypothetical protein
MLNPLGEGPSLRAGSFDLVHSETILAQHISHIIIYILYSHIYLYSISHTYLYTIFPLLYQYYTYTIYTINYIISIKYIVKEIGIYSC